MRVLGCRWVAQAVREETGWIGYDSRKGRQTYFGRKTANELVYA